MESLSDKLKSLGVQVGAANLPKPRPKIVAPVEQILPGEAISTPFGEAFVVDTWYDLDYYHGTILLSSDPHLKMLTAWGQADHLADSSFDQFIFLDTETTGLGGGTGTFAFLVGLGSLSEHGFHLVQLLLRSPNEEPALLHLLNQYLSPFQAVVTYNGKAFDIPLLKTRHVINGFTHPFESLHHLDLLPLARKLWKNRLPSRALADLEVEIVGVSRTQEEVPGWMIPQVYFDYLRTGDARPLAGVLYHNAMDILSLAALFHHMAHLLDDPLGYITPQSLDLIAIARLYEEMGHFDTAVHLYEFSLQLDLPEQFFVQTLERIADLYRKRGDWDKTIELWQKAVDHHQISSCIELAKYYEHQQRDCDQALYWTNLAVEMVDAYVKGIAVRRELKKELFHRVDRLKRKLDHKSRYISE
jgi:uncharacterized protein